MSSSSTDDQHVNEYIASLDDDRREIISTIDSLITETAPGLTRKMWGKFIGYGDYHYKYASGREGDWFIVGLANQKRHASLYLCAANDKGYVAEQNKERLGKVSVGKSCIRFTKIENINLEVVKELITETVNLANKQ